MITFILECIRSQYNFRLDQILNWIESWISVKNIFFHVFTLIKIIRL